MREAHYLVNIIVALSDLSCWNIDAWDEILFKVARFINLHGIGQNPISEPDMYAHLLRIIHP